MSLPAETTAESQEQQEQEHQQKSALSSKEETLPTDRRELQEEGTMTMNSDTQVAATNAKRPAEAATTAPARIPRKVHSDDAVAGGDRSPERKQAMRRWDSANSSIHRHRPVHRKNTNRVRFDALNDNADHDTAQEKDQVDLLNLAAHRSHGIYRDTDSSDGDDHNDTAQASTRKHRHTHDALIQSTHDNLREEKLRQVGGQVEEEDQVDLLGLAANRSHGIYRDTDSCDDDDHKDMAKGTNSKRRHAHDDLIRSTHDNLREEKLRQVGGLVGHTTETAAVQDPSSAVAAAWSQADADAKAKAQASRIQNSPSPPRQRTTHSVSTSIRSAQDTTIPGAYQGAPGQRFVRTQQFDHGVLQQPMLEENPSVRSSATAMTVNLEDGYTSSFSTITRPALPATMDYTSSATVDYTSSGDVISAVRVDEDDLELHIRDEITNNAAQAEVVDLEKETASLVESKLSKVRKKYVFFGTVLLLLLISTVSALVMGILKLKREESDNDDLDGVFGWKPSTLDTVRKRGYLNCGSTLRDETILFDSAYMDGGAAFNTGICEAIAAAALGGDRNVSHHLLSETDRWTALENGTIDVLLVGVPGVMTSLHWNVDPNIPVTFSTPIIFDGVGTGGMPSYIGNCANRSAYVNFMDCRELKTALYNKFADGCCNIISTDYSNDRAEMLLRESSGYDGPYALSEGLFSFQPYAAATRKPTWAFRGNVTDDYRLNDPHVWSEFVNWVINSLIAAEELNITQSTAYQFRQTNAFGRDYQNMFRHAIAAVGNYGELYERTRQSTLPRAGMNMLNDGTTGLHYARSSGAVTDFGPDPYENGTISRILDRGRLICGIPMPLNFTSFNLTTGEMEPVRLPTLEQLQRQGMLPTYLDEILGTANIDIDYCRALSSSVFMGETADVKTCSPEAHEFDLIPKPMPLPRLQLVLFESEADGYKKLASGQVDVVAGHRMDILGDVQETTTRRGFTFSQPYFYGPTLSGHVTDANRCLVTRQHDHQWSEFVQHIVLALFYAEENSCTQVRANQMPVVNRFGPSYKRLFRDAVFAVGNYAEVYARSVEPLHPRVGGPNMLNTESDPQFASLPGLR
ncbi:Putative amino-acid ABC transporter-binding protein YhdW [Seminavis robusta]|uniref:Amino-acid ABC transporter-binding protein YhdW n=1 Tax=Seminavis robusta TaxID=568900 RepID=A0A9N8DWS5_9STRA|nr:Putative amino-acid ABC transporter-binding protein YhdW [Seminavis robusta]|eukprot:Sro435_g142290.1 Putative amino-acid ABC transporter-binding protein YhdW (1086) ;mRNA; r:19796-23302